MNGSVRPTTDFEDQLLKDIKWLRDLASRLDADKKVLAARADEADAVCRAAERVVALRAVSRLGGAVDTLKEALKKWKEAQ